MLTIVSIIIVVGLMATCLIAIASKEKKREKPQDKREILIKNIKAINGFNSTKEHLHLSVGSCIAIDENNKKLCLIKNTPSFSYILLNYKDILSSELIEDGEIITKTSRISQTGGALLGGALLGGVGAVIGGLSGKTKTSSIARGIHLRIVVNNLNLPDHYIPFLNIEAMKDSEAYKSSINIAREWQSIVNIIIRQADDEYNSETDLISTVKENKSIAFELEKLAELRDKGILTDEEFISEKRKVLNR